MCSITGVVMVVVSTAQLSATFCPMSPASAASSNAQLLQSVAGNGHAFHLEASTQRSKTNAPESLFLINEATQSVKRSKIGMNLPTITKGTRPCQACISPPLTEACHVQAPSFPSHHMHGCNLQACYISKQQALLL